MIPSQDIINKLADAVIERIASDRCCNTENIRDALFREWSAAYVAAEAAKPPKVTPGPPQHMQLAAAGYGYQAPPPPPAGYNAQTQSVTIGRRDMNDFMDLLVRNNTPPPVRAAAHNLFTHGHI